MLRYNPDDRPSTKEILEHSLMCRKCRSAHLLESEVVWNEDPPCVNVLKSNTNLSSVTSSKKDASQYCDYESHKEKKDSQGYVANHTLTAAPIQNTVPDQEKCLDGHIPGEKLLDIIRVAQMKSGQAEEK